MPDFSKSCIYKLRHIEDSNNNNIYIGSTVNLKTRITDHKKSCINSTSVNYNRHVYKFIRQNGGWDMWTYDIIEHFPCNDKKTLHIRETYWMDKLKPTLNVYKPYATEQQKNEQHKQYYQNNKTELKNKQKEYLKLNPHKKTEYRLNTIQNYTPEKIQQLKQYRKQYYIDNLQKRKQYVLDNKLKINTLYHINQIKKTGKIPKKETLDKYKLFHNGTEWTSKLLIELNNSKKNNIDNSTDNSKDNSIDNSKNSKDNSKDIQDNSKDIEDNSQNISTCNTLNNSTDSIPLDNNKSTQTPDNIILEIIKVNGTNPPNNIVRNSDNKTFFCISCNNTYTIRYLDVHLKSKNHILNS